jgi:hypothetical protein
MKESASPLTEKSMNANVKRDIKERLARQVSFE